MHLDFVAEGWKPDLDQMEEWMNTRAFPMKVIKDGKEQTVQVPGALRPRRAYTYVFPRENLDVVLNSLNVKDAVDKGYWDGKKGVGRKLFKTHLAILRKLLKLKKIPEPDKDKGTFPMVMKNIRLIGIGIREDEDFTNEKGWTQEAL